MGKNKKQQASDTETDIILAKYLGSRFYNRSAEIK